MNTLPILLAFSLTLAWLAPVANEDASRLTDLAGFKVYQASTETLHDAVQIGILTNRVNSAPGPRDQYRLPVRITERAAWFAVSAFDEKGNESMLSIPVSWKYLWQRQHRPALQGMKIGEGSER